MKKESKFSFSKLDWGQVATALIGSAAAATLGAFADEIIDWLKENRIKSKSKDYFEAMLDAHPALKKQDPETVAKFWASLYHFAPHMAQDPLAAGAFIRQSIDRGYPELYGGPPIDTYSTLTGIDKSIVDVKKKPGRGIYTDIGVSTGGRILGDTLSSNLTYSNSKDQAVSAINSFRKNYREDRKKDLEMAKKMQRQINKDMKGITNFSKTRNS
jgi:hypothetical protein